MLGRLPLLLYIHGFNSSPQSRKCVQLKHYLEDTHIPCEYVAPSLEQWPGKNAQILYSLTRDALQERPVYIIGSSLGGYYGTWLMERLLEESPALPVKLVLINPAVKPWELLADNQAPQTNGDQDQPYRLTREHIEQLKHLEVPVLHRPDNILLLAQTGDQILDYRQAQARYQDCPQRIDKGGSHGFDDFRDTIPVILFFFSPMLIPDTRAGS